MKRTPLYLWIDRASACVAASGTGNILLVRPVYVLSFRLSHGACFGAWLGSSRFLRLGLSGQAGTQVQVTLKSL